MITTRKTSTLAFLALLVLSGLARAQSETQWQTSDETTVNPDAAGRPDLARASRRPDIGIDAVAGFDRRFNIVATGAWAPLLVTVTNNTPKALSLDLRVREQGGGGVEPPTVRQSIEVGPMSRNQVQLTVYLAGRARGENRLSVEASEPDGPIHQTLVPLFWVDPPGSRGERLVVVINDPRAPRGVKPSANRSHAWGGLGAVRIAIASPDLVPVDAAAYEGVAAIVLHDVGRADWLSPGQIDALKGYVMAGGNLIVEGTRELVGRASLVEALAPILAIDPRQIRCIHRPHSFGHVKHGPYDTSTEERGRPPVAAAPLASPGRTALHLVGSVRPHTSGLHWFTYGAYGQGHVTYLGLCLETQALELMKGSMGSPLKEIMSGSGPFWHVRPSGPQSWVDREERTNAHRALELAIRREDYRRLPSHGALLLFLLSYALLAGPGLRLMGVALRRPLAAWAGLPAVIILYIAVVPSAMSIQVRPPEQPIARSLTVLRTTTGATMAACQTVVSIYSPTNASFGMNLPPGHVHFNHLQSGLSNRAVEKDEFDVSTGAVPGVDGLDVNANSMRLYELTGVVSLGGALTLSSSDPTDPQLAIANGTQMPVGPGFVCTGGLEVPFGRLEPGQSQRLAGGQGADRSALGAGHTRFLAALGLADREMLARNERLSGLLRERLRALTKGDDVLIVAGLPHRPPGAPESVRTHVKTMGMRPIPVDGAGLLVTWGDRPGRARRVDLVARREGVEPPTVDCLPNDLR